MSFQTPQCRTVAIQWYYCFIVITLFVFTLILSIFQFHVIPVECHLFGLPRDLETIIPCIYFYLQSYLFLSHTYQITSKYNISIFQKIQIKTYPEEFSRNMYLWMLCHKRTEVIRLGLVTEHSPSPSMEICLCLAQTASSLQPLDGELL